MTTRDSDGPLTVRAPAKVNLGLRVLGERPDGYHRLVTVFQTLALSDRLSLRARPSGREDELAVGGPVSVSSGSDNLVHRALDSLRRAGWEVPPLQVHLHKRIPTEAGLGGGSSDAAAILRIVPSHWPRPESGPDLASLASKLGADVPFLLRGGTALGRGVGQRLTPLPDQRARVLLAVFSSGMASRRAFEALDPDDGEGEDPARVLREHPGEDGWRHLNLANDFTPLVARTLEGFEDVRAGLSEFTDHVALTGSGTALYGLFREPEPRDRAYASLRETFPDVRWLRTRFLGSDDVSVSEGG